MPNDSMNRPKGGAPAPGREPAQATGAVWHVPSAALGLDDEALDLAASKAPFGYGWRRAVERWMSGNADLMAALILDPSIELTEDARVFLADLVRGKVKRIRGRPSRRPWTVEMAVVADVFAEAVQQSAKAHVGNPLERAFLAVGKRRRMSKDAVRGIYERAAEQGITLEGWKKRGALTWTT